MGIFRDIGSAVGVCKSEREVIEEKAERKDREIEREIKLERTETASETAKRRGWEDSD